MASNRRELLHILGFGGHARSVADLALTLGFKRLVFVDVNAKAGEEFAGFPVLRPEDLEIDVSGLAFPAAGDNLLREAQVRERPRRFATLTAPTATISINASVDTATFVGHHAHVGPDTRIGQGVIVNTTAVVEHECRVGDFTHVSIGTVVAGRCAIGRRVFLGAGSTVINGITICDDVVIGAGATVIRDIDSPGTYVGAPARRVPSA